jgi:hypothetical protein
MVGIGFPTGSGMVGPVKGSVSIVDAAFRVWTNYWIAGGKVEFAG